jgi:hypothetical protein
MDLRRLRTGEWIAGAAGLVLLVALFLPWYGGEAGSPPPAGWTAYAPLEDGAASLTGWQSLGALDVVLFVVALAALAIPVVTATERTPAIPLGLQSLTTLAGILALVLVLIRVLNMPDWAVEREWGLWLALVATLGLVIGAFIAIRDERLTREDRHTDLTGVPVATPREIEQLQAPRPEAGS